MQSVLTHPRAIPLSSTRLAASLSVVLVNYRQWEMTARLIAQLRSALSARSGASEIVLVDNHSPSHPLLPQLRRLEGVSVRRWKRNRGFARAVNEGVRLSQGEWVLLLNPDMSVQPGFLDAVQVLTDRLDREEPRTGVVGLGVRDEDGTHQPSAGPFPTLLGTFARMLLPRRWRKYRLAATASGESADWVSGCCLLVRRRVFDELGGLDPSFFLYYEDVDFCHRARQHGWEVKLEPAINAVHYFPLHRRPVSSYMRLLTRHALLQYAAKHWGIWQYRLLSRIVRLEAWVRRMVARLRGNEEGTNWMRQLGRIAEDMQKGNTERARRRLDRAVAIQERSLER